MVVVRLSAVVSQVESARRGSAGGPDAEVVALDVRRPDVRRVAEETVGSFRRRSPATVKCVRVRLPVPTPSEAHDGPCVMIV